MSHGKRILILGIVKSVLFLLYVVVIEKLSWIVSYDLSNFGRARYLQSLTNWDGQYFERIVNLGYYEFEHMHAFFPGFPMIVRGLRSLVGGSGLYVGIFWVHLCTVGSGVLLYILSRMIMPKYPKLSYLSSLFFILNPAQVFLSNLYSESTFCFVSFLGMIFWQKRYPLIASVFFGFSTYVRGNGVLVIGFFLYDILRSLHNRVSFGKFVSILIFTPFYISISISGYVYVQYRGWSEFCTIENENFNQINQKHPWCNNEIPLLYRYVQTKYWNLGLFNYYELSQVPNFLLAMPVIFIVAYGVLMLIRSGLFTMLFTGKVNSKSPSKILHHISSQPFVYYLICQTLSILLFGHVQILTRFLTCSPAFYWFMAEVYLRCSRLRKPLLFYCLSYGLIGTLLFVRFYPWT